MYNVSAICAGKSILDGEALSLAGLQRALSLIDQYTAFTVVTICIQALPGRVKNVLKYVPFHDFSDSPGAKSAAVIDYDTSDEISDDDDLDSVFAGR